VDNDLAHARLDQCEAVIARGLRTFAEVGAALMTIRDQRLYLASYATFENYCQERWKFSRPRAYQLIDAARVSPMVDTRGLPAPANERQARELAPLLDDPDELRDVWEETLEKTGGQPTAKDIAATREKRKPEPVSEPREDYEADPWSDDERDLLKRLRDGETVIVSMRQDAHPNLINWAANAGLYVRIDRRSDWGNPFEMPGDGDRDTVIAHYAAYYLPWKPSLLARLGELRGKALGCWCAPEPCHGDVLKARAEG